MAKTVSIESCDKCPSGVFNAGGHTPGWHCCHTGAGPHCGDRLIFISPIPSWCPLPDAPEAKPDAPPAAAADPFTCWLLDITAPSGGVSRVANHPAPVCVAGNTYQPFPFGLEAQFRNGAAVDVKINGSGLRLLPAWSDKAKIRIWLYSSAVKARSHVADLPLGNGAAPNPDAVDAWCPLPDAPEAKAKSAEERRAEFLDGLSDAYAALKYAVEGRVKQSPAPYVNPRVKGAAYWADGRIESVMLEIPGRPGFAKFYPEDPT